MRTIGGHFLTPQPNGQELTMKSMKYRSVGKLPSALMMAGISSFWCITGCGNSNDSGSVKDDGGNTVIVGNDSDITNADAGTTVDIDGSTPSAGDAAIGPARPTNLPHPTDFTCSTFATRNPTSSCVANDTNVCTTHMDCDEKPNGSCAPNQMSDCYCLYESCRVDADCGGNSVCLCAYHENGQFTVLDALVPWEQDLNVCAQAECKSDADCPAGEYCVITRDYEEVFRVVCTTPEDTCRSDGDCGGALDFCMYIDGHFQCAETQPFTEGWE